jgi:hypothetical protein
VISEIGPGTDGPPSSEDRAVASRDGAVASRDGAVSSEPPTDPRMPAITDEWAGPEAAVISSPYGDYRPPVSLADEPSLTGLSPLSRSKVGSLLFTLAFAAIFVLILVQALVSLFTSGAGQ